MVKHVVGLIGPEPRQPTRDRRDVLPVVVGVQELSGNRRRPRRRLGVAIDHTDRIARDSVAPKVLTPGRWARWGAMLSAIWAGGQVGVVSERAIRRSVSSGAGRIARKQ